jgi:hypothetical protein
MKSHTICEGPLARSYVNDFGGAPPHCWPPEKCAEAEQTTNKQRNAWRICLVALLRRVKINELAKRSTTPPALTTTIAGREIVMATQSYRELLKAQRAEARAKREAEKAEWHRRAELRCEIRKLAMDAVKAGIRARGDKVQLYSYAQLVAQANAMIGPWLVAQPKRQIAERNSKHLHKTRSPEPQALSLCERLDRNGAAK